MSHDTTAAKNLATIATIAALRADLARVTAELAVTQKHLAEANCAAAFEHVTVCELRADLARVTAELSEYRSGKLSAMRMPDKAEYFEIERLRAELARVTAEATEARRQAATFPWEIVSKNARLMEELVRVTAERDDWRGAGKILKTSKDAKIAALRARVADLQQQLDNLTRHRAQQEAGK